MPFERQEGRRWPSPLADRVADGAEVEQVADAVVAIWLEIDEALHPIIGRRGVAALFNRSLNLTAIAHPWLAAARAGALVAVDTSALKAALVRQSASEASAVGSALFYAFRELLDSLIGPSLTDRLLHTVWPCSAGASIAQDTSS